MESKINLQEKEYDALRDELLQWQSRRITLVNISAIVITALLGLEKSTTSQDWEVVSSVLLIFLACVCYLTAYCGASSRTIGAYLECFHGESKWEERLSLFKKKSPRKYFNLNFDLALIYLVMGILAVVVPRILSGNHMHKDYRELFLIAAVLFILCLVWLFLSSIVLSGWLKKRDREKWENVKNLSNKRI